MSTQIQNDNHLIKYAKIIELKNIYGKYVKYDGVYFRYDKKFKSHKRVSVNRIKREAQNFMVYCLVTKQNMYLKEELLYAKAYHI